MNSFNHYIRPCTNKTKKIRSKRRDFKNLSKHLFGLEEKMYSIILLEDSSFMFFVL